MTRRAWTSACWSSILLGVALLACDRPPEAAGEIVGKLRPSEPLAATPQLLELGRATYQKQCEACHGAAGDGLGEAAYLLYPKPRDLTRGQYRLVSSWEQVPTDEDLYLTISRGMPGSAMPAWSHLPERERWGLVHYVKSLTDRSFDIPAPEEPQRQWGEGKGVVRVPAPPPQTAEGMARAGELFAKGCAPCHGGSGRGDGAQEQFDSERRPTRPRDLTAGIFKGAHEPEDVYRRIVLGLPGSPMPMSAYLHGDDAWNLTRLVLGMSSAEQREAMEMKKYRLVARRVDSLPSHPDSGTWGAIEAVRPHLMPLWWRSDRPEELAVQALHDGRELAILLSWSDASYDQTMMRPQDFRDAAAVQFSLDRNPPFFAMGQPQAPVNIWMWKSERQADLEPAYQDLDKIYPNLGIDSYPNFLRSPLEQPARHALTLESDPTYVTAWGVGNIVADPTRRSSAEDLTAQGFGTLRARGYEQDAVRSIGNYATGSHRVMFRRALESAGERSVALRPGSSVAVAFAIWNGSAGDRDGKKSVTIWQELVIAP